MPQKNKGFTGISLKTELYTQIRLYIADNPVYRSSAEFISEAIRLRLETLKHQPTETKPYAY